MRKKERSFGPGLIIAAAFIGPGTVTVCTLAGAHHGYQLLWAVVLSIVITVVFQEMAMRLGIVTGKDLPSLIQQEIKTPVLKITVLGLVLSAIVIGNAAYEVGNISGGALGVASFLPEFAQGWTPVLIGICAFALLWMGNYRILEKGLIALVGLMSLAFVVTALVTLPNITELLKGMFLPGIPENGLLTVLGVVGTTVVPYNLFLHTALAKTQWTNPDHLPQARKDTYVSITIGGVISLAIVICAAAIENQEVSSTADLGRGLEPLFGSWARYLISLGLFAAGITSAITAPLAAAYVLTSVFGWSADLKSTPFRGTWVVILVIGVLFSSLGWKPIEVIRFAQVANGLVLPFIAIFLVWLSSQRDLLGAYANRRLHTVLALILVLLVLSLGGKSIWMVLI